MSQAQQQPKSTSKKHITEISANNEKNQLRKVDQEVNMMKNRVQLLKQQLNKQKESIKKHKQLMKQAIHKKIQVSKINQFKQKDNEEKYKQIQQLRARNRQSKQAHERQLDNIKKAVYLVKLDDARELKNISIEHRKKIKNMEREFLTAQKQKKKRIAQQSEKAKERYMIYWRQKMKDVYTQQAQNLLQTINKKEQKKKELQSLEQQEMKLLQEIKQVHSQQIQSKKQYLAALNIPVKDVASAMEQSTINRSNQQSRSVSSSRYRDTDSYRRSIDTSELRLPKASVNQSKLKIILTQLKNIESRKSSRI